MAATYPGFEVTEDRVAVWFGAFRDVETSELEKALKKFIREDKSAFAPTPGQLFALMPNQVLPERRTQARTEEDKFKSKARIFNQIRRDLERGFATILTSANDHEDRLTLAPLDDCVVIGTWNWQGQSIPRHGLRA